MVTGLRQLFCIEQNGCVGLAPTQSIVLCFSQRLCSYRYSVCKQDSDVCLWLQLRRHVDTIAHLYYGRWTGCDLSARLLPRKGCVNASGAALSRSLHCWETLRFLWFSPQLRVVTCAQVLPIAAAYVGYVILSNMSLKLNTLGFYQMSKICILPVLMVLEGALFSKVPSKVSSLAAVMVCFGMALATVTDQGLVTGTSGFLVGTAAIFVTAMYQIWAGSKQKELQIGSLQLLHQYAPVTALLLIFLVPVLEPVGLFDAQPSKATVLGYAYNRAVVLAMVASCFLGLLVSLSTLLLIGATSSLTFNMVGHVKTVIILLGGCLLFGDTLSYAQAAGVTVALAGVGLYSFDEFWKKKPDIEVAEKAGPVEVSLTKKV